MTRMITLGAAALALVAGLAYWLTAPPAPAPGSLPFAATAQESATDGAADEIDTSTITEMTMGDPDAPVTMVEYASFTCPHCANFHANQFQKLKKEYIDTGKLYFIYRDVYFDRYGLWASMVARCGGQDRFFGISGMIYGQQKDWIGDGQDPVAIADRLRKIGKVAGLSDEKLDACLSDDTWAKTLFTWYRDNAAADEVNATPTLIINGEKVSNQPYEDLKQIIEGELEG